jgi:hypothetical protein
VCDSVLPPTVVHAPAKSLHVLIISLQELQARVAEHADQRRSRKCSWTAARGHLRRMDAHQTPLTPGLSLHSVL